MKWRTVVLVVVPAVLILGGLSSSSAQAFEACGKVKTPGVGAGKEETMWEFPCLVAKANGGWVKFEDPPVPKPVAGGGFCVRVIAGELSTWTSSACNVEKKEKGGWALIVGVFVIPPRGVFPVPLTAKSTAGTLEASTGETITCTADASAGKINGPSTVGNLAVTFTGCIGKSGSSECAAKSPGAKEGTIVTNTLKGEFGEVKASEATTLTGLLLEPASGTEFVTIEGSCLVTAAVSGSLAGEVSPVGVLSSTGKLVFSGSKGTQKIKEITVLTKVDKPALTAFGGLVSASEATSEALTFGEPLLIT
jgi:hypothetical protein